MSTACAWQPIATAPRNGTAVLLFHPAWDMLQVGIHYEGSIGWQAPCGDLLRTPMYWMLLPPAPPEPPRVVEPAAGQGRIAM